MSITISQTPQILFQDMKSYMLLNYPLEKPKVRAILNRLIECGDEISTKNGHVFKKHCELCKDCDKKFNKIMKTVLTGSLSTGHKSLTFRCDGMHLHHRPGKLRRMVIDIITKAIGLRKATLGIHVVTEYADRKLCPLVHFHISLSNSCILDGKARNLFKLVSWRSVKKKIETEFKKLNAKEKSFKAKECEDIGKWTYYSQKDIFNDMELPGSRHNYQILLPDGDKKNPVMKAQDREGVYTRLIELFELIYGERKYVGYGFYSSHKSCKKKLTFLKGEIKKAGGKP